MNKVYLDGVKLLSWEEAEEILKTEDSKNNPSVADVIISMIGDDTSKPLHGSTRLQKGIFIALKERLNDDELFAKFHYIPYRYGPWSFYIKEILGDLISSGYVSYRGKKNTNSQKFYLTKKGERYFKTIKEANPKIVDVMDNVRKDTDELTVRGILRYIYNNPKYKNYLVNSAVRKRYEDITWGK